MINGRNQHKPTAVSIYEQKSARYIVSDAPFSRGGGQKISKWIFKGGPSENSKIRGGAKS